MEIGIAGRAVSTRAASRSRASRQHDRHSDGRLRGGQDHRGELLARQTGWVLYDADDFHTPANIEKMRSGIPLTDEDRWPWLDRLNAVLRETDQHGRSAILACSALKERYRDRLAQGNSIVRWVHLTGTSS